MLNDVSNQDFVLANALAIDMEWKNKIQSVESSYSVDYAHENFSHFIYPSCKIT